MRRFTRQGGCREQAPSRDSFLEGECKHPHQLRRPTVPCKWHGSFPRLSAIDSRGKLSIETYQCRRTLNDLRPEVGSNIENPARLKQPKWQLLRRLATRVQEIFLSFMRGTNS